MTIAPVSRITRYEVEVSTCAAAAKTSGRWRRSQRIFGPTDCEVSRLPQRAISVAAPKCAVRSSTSTAARVSTPYRTAFISGRPEASTGNMQGPMALSATQAMRRGSAPLSASTVRDRAQTASHQSASARCSAHPDRGTIISCARSAWARIRPCPSASTAFDP